MFDTITRRAYRLNFFDNFEQARPMRGGHARKEVSGISSDATGCGPLPESGAFAMRPFRRLVERHTPRVARFIAGFPAL